ncbi:MAG: XRE family transcriptional regulator [Pseudomonadota bacterium]
MTSAPRPPLRAVRLLRRTDAAGYCGVSVAKFDEMVRDGRLPGAHRVDGCVLWELRELDAAIDELLYGDEPALAELSEGSGAGWGG